MSKPTATAATSPNRRGGRGAGAVSPSPDLSPGGSDPLSVIAARLATAEATDLVLDPLSGPRNGLEALHRDRIARHLADAVGAQLELREGVVDLDDGRAGLRRQGEVALALHAQGVALAGLLVELHVARLEVGHERFGLGLHALGLLQVDGPLALERLLLGPQPR